MNYSRKTVRMKRDYGVDMLKIFAMIGIVLDHILLWGGVWIY